ncbi:MAG: hypothetical protein ACRENG_11720, partial [bacterium]
TDQNNISIVYSQAFSTRKISLDFVGRFVYISFRQHPRMVAESCLIEYALLLPVRDGDSQEILS